jgi:hypothetical protein
MLATLPLASTAHAAAAVPKPFSATYAVSYRGISAGTITFAFSLRDASQSRRARAAVRQQRRSRAQRHANRR